MRISIDVTQKMYDEMTGIAHGNGFDGLKDWMENIFLSQYNSNRLQRLALDATRKSNKLMAVVRDIQGADSAGSVEPVAENVLPFKKPEGDPEFNVSPKNEKKIDDILKKQERNDNEQPDNAS